MTIDKGLKELKEHEQTGKLLPWYVNDTLVGKEAELVLKHLVHCQTCQAERDRLYQLQQLVQESDLPTPGYEMSYHRVMQRIEAAERNKQSTQDVDQLAGRRRFFPLGVAASFLIAILAGGVWFSNAIFNNAGRTISGDEFQTLSTDFSNKGVILRLELGFVSPIPAATMRQALIETHSNIVSGPDKNGNYLVDVIVPIHMSNNEYLSQIQDIEGVERARFTEN